MLNKNNQAPTKEDKVWQTVRREVTEAAKREPLLASFLYAVVLNHRTLEDALSYHLASKLESSTLPAISMRDLIDEAYANDPAIGQAIRADIMAVCDRDPACDCYSTPLIYFKGFHALQTYRATHYFWNNDRQQLAMFIQSRMADTFGVDIHPAARIGQGIMMDHATGIVIGETAVISNNVSMLHEVTLGGSGKIHGDRHPKIGEGVLIGAGAKIIGNVRVGEGAKVGAGAVVLEDVPPHVTVVGVPAKVVGKAKHDMPALEMDHGITPKA
jgi:serine O-acetyltransferase